MWKSFKNNRVVQWVASFDVTVVCLLFLMILTFWGTLYQVDQGLYAAQHRMFRSWFFTFFGFIPFPGARLVLWFTFINLLTAGLIRNFYHFRKIGLVFVHFGLLLLVVSSGFTFHFAQESVLSLAEGEGSNVSDDYHDWELALWQQTMKGDTITRDGEAIPIKSLKAGEALVFKSFPASLKIENAYLNCKALTGPPPTGILPNPFNINELVRTQVSSDPAENYPGAILELPSQAQGKLIVYGGAPSATPIDLNGKPAFISLRRKKHLLPITLQLVDFKKSEHPGTNKARSYESIVTVSHDGIVKDASISMNKPYREAGFTFYQASFSQSGQSEVSTFAVVKNDGRILPYICCLMVGGGLILHFVMKLIFFARRKSLGEQNAA